MNFNEISQIIKKLENIFILTDNDLDGISSGILMAIILRKIGINHKVTIREHGKLDYKYLRKVINRKYKSIILLDSPFKDEDLIKLVQELKEKKIIYIDHHKREVPENLPENLVYFDIRALGFGNISVSGVVYRIGKEIFGEEFKKYSWIAALGAMGDFMYETDDIVKKDFEGTYQKIFLKAPMFFLYEILMYGGEKLMEIDPLEEFHKVFEKEFVKTLKRNFNNSVKKMSGLKVIYKSKKLEVYESNAPSLVSTMIGSLKPDKVIVCYHRVGFLGKRVKVSLRFQNSEKIGIDLGKFAKEFTEKYGIQGGGHPPAAGMLIYSRDLQNLIEELEIFIRQKA